MKARSALAAAAVGLVLLTGCAKATAQDRDSNVGGGTTPDSTGDATHVDLYRNADGVPTLILFCADGLRFASTPSSLTSGSSREYITPALLRLPEQDGLCGKKAQ